jgi:hypothetical protein
MKQKIEWQIVVENGQIGTMERVLGLPQDSASTHLFIIGILENMKQQHLNKLNTLLEINNKGVV